MTRRPSLRRWLPITLLVALLLRLVDLGTRTAHWDEARVGWWVIHAIETGTWHYRPIVHGPFVQHAARASVLLLDPSDFALRLPVALVSLLLPAGAILFRTRLSNGETLTLAGLLAVDPLLLHYSRFFRSDVPLAAFAFVTAGCLVRLYETRRRRWLVAAVVAFAFALTTKENAVLYPVSWLGASVATGAVFYWRAGWRPAGRSRLANWNRETASRWLRRWTPAIAGAVALALAVVVLWYAPRTPGSEALGLWTGLADPSKWPALVGESTLGSIEKVRNVWIHDRSHPYGPFLGHYLLVLATGSGTLVAMAIVGTIQGRDRPLVIWSALWGVSSIVGYPYVADIEAPWLVVNAVVPLALPAGVGVVAVWRALRDAVESPDRWRAMIFGGLLVVAAGQVAVMGVGANYVHPVDEQLVIAQGGQPASQWGPTIERIDRAAAHNPRGNPDVAFYGYLAGPEPNAGPAESGWFRRLPFPWYVAANDWSVVLVDDPSELGDPPPVVVTRAPPEPAVRNRLSDYNRTKLAMLRHGRNTTYRFAGYTKHVVGESVVVYVRSNPTGS